MVIKDKEGKFTIKVDTKRAIVYEEPIGIWDQNDIERFHKNYTEKIVPLFKGRQWAKCCNLKGYKVSKIADNLKEHTMWAFNNGLKHTAMIVDSFVVQNQMKRTGGDFIILDMFETFEEADQWLSSEGY